MTFGPARFSSRYSKEQMLLNFKVSGHYLIQTWASGNQAKFDLAQNNEFGLVGVGTISAVEPYKKIATLGASAVIIDRRTKEFWLGNIIAGQPSQVNEIVHGTCINR